MCTQLIKYVLPWKFAEGFAARIPIAASVMLFCRLEGHRLSNSVLAQHEGLDAAT